MKPILQLATSLVILLFPMCPTAFSHSQNTPAPAAAVQPQTPLQFSKESGVIYVSDFELDSANFTPNQGPADNLHSQHQGVIQGPRKRMQGNPQQQAQKLVDLMATSVVNDLTKAGYHAQRLIPGDAHPSTGLWVHGVFTQLDEGNRMQRAVIGFGAGSANMQLYVTMSDLARPQQSLYDVEAADSSKNKPGAVITMNPYVAAAKFVMEKNAPEKVVKQTASEISAKIVQRLNGATAAPDHAGAVQ